MCFLKQTLNETLECCAFFVRCFYNCITCRSFSSFLNRSLFFWFDIFNDTGTSWDQLTDDNVFFQTAEWVNLTFDCSFSQNTGCFLEGSSRHEGIGCQRSFGDTHKYCMIGCRFAVDSVLCLQCKQFFICFTQFRFINQGTGDQLGIAAVIDADFTHHLTNDNFDMLIVDIYTLCTVYTLYLFDQVILNSQLAAYGQNLTWFNGTFGDQLTFFNILTFLNDDLVVEWYNLGEYFTICAGNVNSICTLVIQTEVCNTGNMADDCCVLWFSCLEQLFNPWKTLCNIACGSNTTGMESTHGQLGTCLLYTSREKC